MGNAASKNGANKPPVLEIPTPPHSAAPSYLRDRQDERDQELSEKMNGTALLSPQSALVSPKSAALSSPSRYSASVFSSAASPVTSFDPAGRLDVADDSALSPRLAVTSFSPVAPSGELSLDLTAGWEENLRASPKAKLARTILTHNNIQTTLISREAAIADTHIFNNVVDFKTGPVTNQKSSGRCWIFATTNVLRYNIMKKLNLDSFQLSQSYLFFWDKLNKSNYFLETMIDTAGKPLDDRLVNHLLGDIISDGGQWDMAVNLLERYGVVPQALYPESTHSSLTGPLNSLLKTKLREHALILRRLSTSLRSQYASEPGAILATLRAKKEELMKEVYTVMTATLGVPPSPDASFKWEYYDKDGKFGSWEGSAKDFYEKVAIGGVKKGYEPSSSFSLINDPRNDYNKLYTVNRLGNVWGGRPVTYVNTDSETMKQMVVKMIKANIPVFFGCDVGKFSDREKGVMDPGLFEYESTFDIQLSLTKSDRLRTNESAMTHAMVISGVHLDKDGKPVRYKVENSWGDAVGNKGWYVMSDKWFDEFTYQVVVPKALAPSALVKIYESPIEEAVVFPPWDPMGTLA